MNSENLGFDKIVMIICTIAIIGFAIYRNGAVTAQNEVLKYPSATEFNYK